MTAYEAGQVTGYIIGVGLAAFFIWWAIRGTRGGKKLEMLAAEVRIADIYAECKLTDRTDVEVCTEELLMGCRQMRRSSLRSPVPSRL